MTELPRGWTGSTLADVAVLPTRGASTPNGSGTRPTLTFRGVRPDGSTELSDLVAEEQARAKGMVLVEEGDIVLTNQGHASGWIGKKVASIGRDAAGAYAASTLQVVRPTRDVVDPRFLYYVLASRGTYQWLFMAAGGRTSMTRRGFGALPIMVPPLAEQERIVAVIEEHVSRLDAAESLLKRAAKNLSHLQVVVDRSAICEQWPKVRIEQVIASDRKLAYGVLQPGPHVEDGIPLVRVNDIQGGAVRTESLKRINPEIASRYPRTKLQGGEVLLTVVGTIGRVAVAPRTLSGANVARAVAVVPLDPTALPEFVSLMLGSPESVGRLVRLAHEVARKTLNLEDVRKIHVPLPALDVQERVVAEHARSSSVIGSMLVGIDVAHRRSTALREATLHRAFTGGLIPSGAFEGSAVEPHRSATSIDT
jgi:restriction endonuclease S subunit